MKSIWNWVKLLNWKYNFSAYRFKRGTWRFFNHFQFVHFFFFGSTHPVKSLWTSGCNSLCWKRHLQTTTHFSLESIFAVFLPEVSFLCEANTFLCHAMCIEKKNVELQFILSRQSVLFDVHDVLPLIELAK